MRRQAGIGWHRNVETVRGELQRMGCSQVAGTDNGIPAALVRCGCGRHSLAGVESGVKPSTQVKLLAAAISWHLAGPNKDARLRYIVASPEGDLPKLSAAFQLLTRDPKIPVDITIGSDPLSAERMPFPEKKKWVKALNTRARLTVPDTLRGLTETERDFRWYRALTGKTWSGRLRGLEICTADAPDKITFNVGREGKGGQISKQRDAFGRALKDRKLIACTIEESRQNLARLWNDAELEKESATAEHAFEFQILAGKIAVAIDDIPLVPVEPNVPYQFPAQWWPGRQKRHIDALMKNGAVPWVAELKVGRSQGNYYREGIVQAALYRGFIRAADWLNPWFKAKDLDRSQCAAVLVIPELRGGQKERLGQELDDLARIFDVRVVKVKWPP